MTSIEKEPDPEYVYWMRRALDQAEAERDAQTDQCHYWKALHERSEARLQAQKAAHADQIKYWQGEARIHRRRADDMEDNTLRAQSNTRAMEERARRAEARTRVVRDVLGHLDPHAARLLREALDGDAWPHV